MFSNIGSTRDSVTILHFKTSTISRGPPVDAVLGCCYRPVSSHGGHLPSPWAPFLPLWSFPSPPWARRGSSKVTCTGDMHISEGPSDSWALGVCSFSSTSHRCVFSVSLSYKLSSPSCSHQCRQYRQKQ